MPLDPWHSSPVYHIGKNTIEMDLIRSLGEVTAAGLVLPSGLASMCSCWVRAPLASAKPGRTTPPKRPSGEGGEICVVSRSAYCMRQEV